MNKIRVGFTGWAGSGKSDAARYLQEKYDCEIVSFADGIKFVDRYLFGTGAKNRKRLQDIGEFFRSYDSEIWVNRTLETVEFMDNACIDDLRRFNEYEALIKNGFKIVRIVSDEDKRVERLTKRDGKCDVSILYNESESGCSKLDLIEIYNNGTNEEMYAQIDLLMEKWIYEKKNLY